MSKTYFSEPLFFLSRCPWNTGKFFVRNCSLTEKVKRILHNLLIASLRVFNYRFSFFFALGAGWSREIVKSRSPGVA